MGGMLFKFRACLSRGTFVIGKILIMNGFVSRDVDLLVPNEFNLIDYETTILI